MYGKTACMAEQNSAPLFSDNFWKTVTLFGHCLDSAISTFSLLIKSFESALLLQKIESTFQCIAMWTQPLLFRLYSIQVFAFTTLQGKFVCAKLNGILTKN